MARTVELNAQNFKQTVEAGGTLFIDWWAAWCGPCRAFAPIYEKVAENHPDITFAKINTEEQPQLAAMFGIESIPTLMVFRDRVLLMAQPGALPAASLERVVDEVKKLDMDEVRRQIAAEQQEGGARDEPKS